MNAKLIKLLITYCAPLLLSAQLPCMPEIIDLNIKGITNTKFSETKDNNYIIFGDSINNNNKTYYSFIRKIDFNGTEIWTRYYSGKKYTSLKLVKEISQNRHIFSREYFDSTIRVNICEVICIDNLGNKLFEKSYQNYFINDVYEDSKLVINLLFHEETFNRYGIAETSYQITRIQISGNGNELSNKFIYFTYSDSLFGKLHNYRLGPIKSKVHVDAFDNLTIICNYQIDQNSWPAYCHNFLLKASSDFNLYKTIKLASYEIDFPIKIIEGSNGEMHAWFNDEFVGYDGSQSLISSYIIDSSGNLKGKKNYHGFGYDYLGGLIKTDSNLVFLYKTGLVSWTSNGALLSKSTFTFHGLGNPIASGEGLIQESTNGFVCLGTNNTGLCLIRYPYFGNDCRVKISGICYLDTNNNCIYGPNEEIYTFNTYLGDYISPNAKGEYSFIGEYGINILSPNFPNKVLYEFHCGNQIGQDTVKTLYPINDVKRDLGFRRKPICLLFNLNTFVNKGKPGGINTATINVYNQLDSTLYNPILKINRTSFNKLISCNKPFSEISDTIIIKFDSILPLSGEEIIIQDSILCNTFPRDTVCYQFSLEAYNRCTNLIERKLHNYYCDVLQPSWVNDELIYFYTNSFSSRPCERGTTKISYNNRSSQTQKNLEITVFPDKLLTNLYTIPPATIMNDKLIFNIPILNSQETSTIFIIDSISCKAKEGTNLCTKYEYDNIIKCGEHRLSKSASCIIINNSKDPNYIEAQLKQNTNCYQYNDKTPLVNYIIHFQNTGSAPALQVKIYDTLNSKDFDLSTIKDLGGKHKYTLRILQDSILEFVFKNINLIDSSTNEDESKSYLTYQVRTTPYFYDAFNSSTIYNRAGIYFDNNDVVNTDYHSLRNCGYVLKNNNPNHSTNIYIYPNPTNQSFKIFNSEFLASESIGLIVNNQGQILRRLDVKELNTEIKLDEFNSGLFTLIIQDRNRVRNLKFAISR